MATSITKPAGASTVGCVIDIEISSAQPNVHIKIKPPANHHSCLSRTKPIIVYPPPGWRGANVRTTPTGDVVTAIETVAVRSDAGDGSATEIAAAQATLLGKGRGNPQTPPNWKKKIRVSLCDYLTQACIRAGQNDTWTIEVYDKNGTLLDSINVTLGPKCDCPGGQ